MDWLDLYLPRNVDDATIAQAIAAAFVVPVTTVHVAPENTAGGLASWKGPHIRILVTRERGEHDPKDEYPIGLTILLKQPVDQLVEPVLRLGQHLGMPFITNAEVPDYPDTLWRLVTPDGWTGVVDVDDDAYDEGSMVLTPASRQVLNAHMSAAQATNLRRVGKSRTPSSSNTPN